MIRNVALTAALLFTVSTAQAFREPQVKDDLFAGAEKFAAKAKETNEINLDKKMLGMAAHFGGDKDNGSKDLIKNLDFVIVRSYEFAQAGDYDMADVDVISKRLDSNGWSHVVKERTATTTTDVCLKTDNEDTVSELVVIDAEPKELTFVHLKGHLSMEQLMKAGSAYGVPQGGTPPLKKR